MKITFGCFAVTVFLFTNVVRAQQPSSQVIDSLRSALTKENPNLGIVTILDVRAIKDQYLDVRGFVVLARGIRQDLHFKGKFEDELFALFRFDKSFSKILRAYDFIPTFSWNDYQMVIEKITSDSVFVFGQGATHGDAVLRKAYPLK